MNQVPKPIPIHTRKEGRQFRRLYGRIAGFVLREAVFSFANIPKIPKTMGAVRRAKEVMIKCVTVIKRMRGTMGESKEKCIFMTKRIGSTVFKVRVYLPEDGTETAEEKNVTNNSERSNDGGRKLWYNRSATNEPSV